MDPLIAYAAILALLSGLPCRAQTATLTGGFGTGTPLLDSGQTVEIVRSTPLWDSWQANDTQVGTVSYGPFPTGSAIELWVNGFPNSPNERIYLENLSSGARLRLATRTQPGGPWTRYRWALPAEWRQINARLFAEDTTPEPNQWLGLSAPLPLSSGWGNAGIQSLLQIAVCGLLLLPGLAILTLLRTVCPITALAIVLVFSGITAYLIFFIYLEFYKLGPLVSWIILGGSLVAIVSRRNFLKFYLHDSEFHLPLWLSATVATFFVLLGYAYGGMESPAAIPLMRFFPELPPDPLLPYWFAEKIANHLPLRPFLLDWLTSDRPPLQTGMNLLLWPLMPGALGYEAIGAAAQSWVWIGLWILLRSLTVSRKTVGWILTMAVLSGFYFVNTVYCWPKLLPTAFLLIASGIIFGAAERKENDWTLILLASASVALAILGHGGSYFGVGGIILVYLIQRRPLSIRALMVAFVAIEWLLLPWQLYQKLADPPGDRLIKYHLAGRPAIDPRPSLTVIRESYHQLSWSEILNHKLGAFDYVFFGWKDWTAAAASSLSLLFKGHLAQAYRVFSWATRDGEYHFYSLMLGPSLLALLALFTSFRKNLEEVDRRMAGLAAMLAVATLMVWCLLMWGWGATAIQNSSLYLGALLLLLAGTGLSALPRWLQSLTIVLQAAWFCAVWACTSQREPGSGSWYPSAFPGYFMAAGMAFAAVAICLFKIGHREGKISETKLN